MNLTDETVDRSEVAGLLARIRDLKAYKKEIEEELASHESAVRKALDEDPDPLVDGEHRLVATLKPRRKPDECDLISFADKPDAPRLLAEAAKQGVLAPRLTQLKGLKGKSEAADALLAMLMPGGETHVLTIESFD